MRRPVWLGAGIVLGVGGTLWAEQRVRRRVRRVVEVLSPAVAGNEAVRAARGMGGRVMDALEAARAESRRHEADLWRQMGEVAPAGPPAATPRSATSAPQARGGRRQHR